MSLSQCENCGELEAEVGRLRAELEQRKQDAKDAWGCVDGAISRAESAEAAINEAAEQRDATWIEILTGLGKADTASIVAAAIRARSAP